MSDTDQVYKGQCFCGRVKIEAHGAPFAMGYCHCHDCRDWSAGPVNAFTLWKRDAVKVIEGENYLSTYNKTENSDRKFCFHCGGHVMSDHPGGDFTDVYAALLPQLTFTPALHVNYGSTVLRMPDGLPKFRDFPAEFGGSGEQIPD